jgi:hypothetical protein
VAGDVFLSYSRVDQAYAERLAEYLAMAGVGVRYDRVLDDQLADCAAVVVIVTPAAKLSTSVERAVRLAERTGRPIVPVLRSGTHWWRVAGLPSVDVRDDTVPDVAFVGRLRELCGPHGRHER